jgi:hypothetical protein
MGGHGALCYSSPRLWRTFTPSRLLRPLSFDHVVHGQADLAIH